MGVIPFIKNLSAIPVSIAKFFIPFNLSTLPLFDNASIIIGIIIIAILFFVIFKYAKNEKIIMPSLVWFFAFTAMPLIFRLKDANYFATYFEHRFYITSIGLIFILAPLFQLLIHKIRPAIVMSGYCCILFVFMFLAYNHSSDYKESNSFFSRAIEVTPGNAGAYSNRGMYYESQGNTEMAINDYNSALNIFPDPVSFLNRGSVYSENGDHVAAEKDFSNAIIQDTSYILAYLYRGIEKEILKDTLGAINDFNKIIVLNSNYIQVYMNLGDLDLKLNKNEEAVKNFTKAYMLSNNDTRILEQRSLANFRANNIKASIEDDIKILQSDSSNVKIYVDLGQKYGILSQPQKALECFNRAIYFSANSATAYYGRGLAKKELKDMEGACRDWHEAARLGSDISRQLITRFCK